MIYSQQSLSLFPRKIVSTNCFRLENKVAFGLWCTRYLCTFFIFILGIKAPGISTVRDYYPRHEGSEVIIAEKYIDAHHLVSKITLLSHFSYMNLLAINF